MRNVANNGNGDFNYFNIFSLLRLKNYNGMGEGWKIQKGFDFFYCVRSETFHFTISHFETTYTPEEIRF